MLGLRLRVHDVLRFSTKNSTNDRIISIFRRSFRAICRSPDSLQEMAGHRHPPVLRIAKYPGDWERGNLTKCESKFASPQSSPSKSCNDLSRTVPCPESLLIYRAQRQAARSWFLVSRDWAVGFQGGRKCLGIWKSAHPVVLCGAGAEKTKF